MLQFLAAGARAFPALARLAGGKAFVQQVLPGLGGMGWKDAAMRYGPELAFAGLNAAQAPGDVAGKGLAFGESLAAGLLPSVAFQRAGFSMGHRRAAAKGLMPGSPEFAQKVGEYTDYGDKAAMVPSMLYPMPLTQGVYQKEAERQQALAQQQQFAPGGGLAGLAGGLAAPRQEAAADGFDVDALTRRLAQEQIQAAASNIDQGPGIRMAGIPDELRQVYDELYAPLVSPYGPMRM